MSASILSESGDSHRWLTYFSRKFAIIVVMETFSKAYFIVENQETGLRRELIGEAIVDRENKKITAGEEVATRTTDSDLCVAVLYDFSAFHPPIEDNFQEGISLSELEPYQAEFQSHLRLS